MSTPETVQVTKELFIIMIGYLQNKNRKDSPVVNEKKEKKLRKNSAVSHISTEIEVDSVRWIFN